MLKRNNLYLKFYLNKDMTIYGGGKARIGCRIYEAINKVILDKEEKENKKYEIYIEPFCGMLGVAHHFIKNEKFNKYILSDINNNIILLWNKLKNKNWILPDLCSKEEYNKIIKSKTCSALKGYYGVACSYYGMFGGRYKPNVCSKIKTQMLGQLVNKYSSRIKIICKSYDAYKPKGFVIYCDPPYKNNTLENFFKNFDHDKFWNIMREWSKDNLVFISEYEAPSDFKCIWHKQFNSCFNGVIKNKIERLFIYSPD